MSRKPKQTQLPTQADPIVVAPHSDWFQSLSQYKKQIAWALALMAVVWGVFRVTSNFSFLSLDDREVVTANRIVTGGLTAESIGFVFWDRTAGNWAPLTWVSHMLDVQWDGLDPAAHHDTNVWLHVLASGLFFLTLAGLTGAPGRSLAAAALFALHPLRAQSVAWVAERQGLLAACLSFAALAAWARWRKRESRLAYGFALGFFALALMASPAAAALPLILLLLEYWPLESGGLRVAEKVPFLALSAGAVALWFARYSAATVERGTGWGVEAAFGPALWYTIWPVALTPLREGGTARITGVVAVVAIVAFTLGRRYRFLLTGLVWFAGSLAVSVALSEFARHVYADRFTYFAHAGLMIALVWMGHALLGDRSRYLAMAIGIAIAWQCWVQLAYWRDDDTLFGRAIELNPRAADSLAMLGQSYLQRQQPDRAIETYRKAVTLNATAAARLDLAQALFVADRNADALTEIDAAIRLDPKLGRAHHNRGLVLRALGKQEEARDSFKTALESGLNAGLRQDALLNLGLIDVKLAQYDSALRYFQLALEVDQRHYLARKNVAFIYMRQEKWKDAQREFERLFNQNTEDEDVQKGLRFLKQRIP